MSTKPIPPASLDLGLRPTEPRPFEHAADDPYAPDMSVGAAGADRGGAPQELRRRSERHAAIAAALVEDPAAALAMIDEAPASSPSE